MATYPVVNTKTGDRKEVVMSVNDWDQWRTDNPDWSRDYSDPSTMPGVGEVGEWKNKLVRRKPGWNEVLERVQKYPGAKKQKPWQGKLDFFWWGRIPATTGRYVFT